MAFESYVIKNGKRFRKGYTTGSSAAAAAKAATKILFSNKKIGKIEIDTPAGVTLHLDLVKVEVKRDYVRVAVVKDAGDDPDVTDGLEVFAKVKEIEKGIKIEGGEGVGRVTKPGLAIPVGKAAINPIPRKMIKREVSKVLPAGKGVRVMIEIPRGKEIAQKTFNPKLGIEGGISILGTTGIVEPMSESAYRESLALELRQAVALGREEIILVFGNYGKDMAKKLGFKEKAIIRMSNFVGFMLKECLELGVKKVIILGNIGKIVKVAAGIFNTHSRVADGRLETIAAYTAALGGKQELIKEILASNTSEEAVQIVKKAGMEKVFNLLAERVVIRAKEYINNEFEVKCLIFSMQEGILGSYGFKDKKTVIS